MTDYINRLRDKLVIAEAKLTMAHQQREGAVQVLKQEWVLGNVQGLGSEGGEFACKHVEAMKVVQEIKKEGDLWMATE